MTVVDPDAGLVGREAALHMAGAVLHDALDGAGQLLLVTGEPGLGKSALLSELSRRAADRGARVLRGICWSDVGAPPYWPWTQVLRGVEPHLTAASRAGRLLDGAPGGGAGSAEEAADDRFQLFDAVADLLVGQAREQPLLVVLDDLQWADGQSLALLEFVVGQLATQPVLVLGAYRDTESSSALRGLRGQRLPLDGLDRSHVAQLIAEVAGSQPPAEWADAVWRRCGGNPFFVRELTRLVGARGGWENAGPDGPPIPQEAQQTLSQRLARLSQPCVNLLTVAAISGTEVRPDLLSLVSGSSPDIVAELLDEAIRARVVVVDDGPRIAHDLFRQTILTAMPSAKRAQLHAAVGRSLLDLAGSGSGEDLSAVGGAARVAAHFVAAGRATSAEALRYSVLAAKEATARLGHADAAGHYENALAALSNDLPRRVELLVELGAARDRAGDQGAARAAYQRAADLAQSGADARGLGLAALGLHGLGNRSGADNRVCMELLTAADTALRDLSESGPHEANLVLSLRSCVLAALARMHRHTSINTIDPLARDLAAQAVQLAEAADDATALSLAHLAAHDVSWEPGSAAARLHIVAAMADAAKRSGDQDLAAEALLLRATALIELGDPAGRSELTHYTNVAEGLGHARGRWGALSRRATLAGIGGRVDEALELSYAAMELGHAIGIQDTMGVFSTLRASLVALGASVPKIFDGLPETDPLWPVFPLFRAWRAAFDGNHDEAAAQLRGFVLEDISYKYDLELLAIAAMACAAAGSLAQQEWVYARLEPLAGLHAVVGGCAAYYGAVDHYLGQLAAALGRTQQARQHFLAAIEAYDRLAGPAWADLSRRELEQLEAARPRNVFRNDGDTWELTFDGHEVHLPDAKGLHDIAVLLGSPGQHVHVFTLLGMPAPPAAADPILDARAKAHYAARLAELDTEIDDADAAADPVRSERALAERAALLHELSASTGLGGRRRRLGDETERARKTVGARIRDVLVRIERIHPALGRHLHDTISTGTTCTYAPPEHDPWIV